MSFLAFRDGETITHTDEGHGREYSAKRTVTTKYKHPKGIRFTHVHEDGRDYEDVYRYETLKIEDVEIRYAYDWGNYFIFEYMKISKTGEEVGYAERTYGAVDALKTETRHKEEGATILRHFAEEFGMTMTEFLKECESTFKMSLECLKLFM